MNVKIVISSMRLFAALMLVIGCGNAFSAEGMSCRRVLLIERTLPADLLADLVRLQTDIDHAKTQGVSHQEIDTSEILFHAFEGKLHEVSKESGGAFTVQELRQKIREEIKENRNSLAVEKKAVEDQQRAKEKISLGRLKFSFDRRIKKPELLTITSDYFSEYVEELNAFIWLAPNKVAGQDSISGFSLMRIDLNSEAVTVLRDDITAITLLSDRSKAAFMTLEGNTEVVDLRNGEVKHRVPTTLFNKRVLNLALGPKDKAGIIAVNKSQSVIAVSEGFKVYLFDLATGEFRGSFQESTGFNSHIANIRFVSDREVVFNHGGNIVKWNVDSLDHISQKIFSGVAVFGLEVSADGRRIFLLDLKNVEEVRASDLSIVGNAQPLFSTPTRSRVFKSIPNTQDQLIHIGSNSTNRFGVFFLDDLATATVTFDKYRVNTMQGHDVTSISVGSDHSAAVVIGLDSRVPFLDIWKYSE